jgi:acetyl-CoA carboxylase carboxyltransferase component
MQHLSAYQRIEALTDRATFEETGAKGESIITGIARINSRYVFIIASDTSVNSGSIGQASAQKINAVLDMAMRYRYPVVALFESVGARVQEGVTAMHHIGILFRKFAELSGLVPTIAILNGVNSGATAYAASLMDYIIMVKNTSYAFITGPKVVEVMTAEKDTLDDLGGTALHAATTGLATFVETDEYRALQKAKTLLQYLPQHCFEYNASFDIHIKKERNDEAFLSLLPENNKRGYDMNSVIDLLADDHSVLQLQEAYAPNLITAFARLGGATIGIAANQPLHLAGILDTESCRKLFRFIQWCDAYNIPLLFIADSPGFMPGKEQEQSSMVAMGARVLNVLANSTVPKITLIINKIIGGAYGGMSSAGLGADLVFAWPTAQVAILGAASAVSVLYPKASGADDKETAVKRFAEAYEKNFLSPYPAAHHGQVDAVIHPRQTRQLLLRSFFTLQDKAATAVKKRRTIIPM